MSLPGQMSTRFVQGSDDLGGGTRLSRRLGGKRCLRICGRKLRARSDRNGSLDVRASTCRLERRFHASRVDYQLHDPSLRNDR